MLINILFDSACHICGARLYQEKDPVCSKCLATLNSSAFLPPLHTQHTEYVLSRFAYRGISAKYVKLFKYHIGQKMTGSMRSCIRGSAILKELMRIHPDIIVSVPPSPIKRLKGVFDPVSCFSGIVSDLLGVPVAAHALVKKRMTAHQTRLGRSRRISNLYGAFSVIDKNLIDSKRILLVDDVITTGTTMDTCASELLKHGALSIHGFTLARAGHY